MSSVQFLRWKVKERSRYRSYKELKNESERFNLAVLQALRKFSGYKSETELITCSQAIIAGEGWMIPTDNIDRAEDLTTALETLGAEVRLREIDNACRCENCGRFTLAAIGQNPEGFFAYHCEKCSEVLRACPDCGGQGWLRHYRSEKHSIDWLMCDECESCWNLAWERLPNSNQNKLIDQSTRLIKDSL